MFQEPRLTPPSLSVVTTIKASSSQQRYACLGAVSLVTGRRIILLDKVKEVVKIELSLKHQQNQQVGLLSR